MNRRSFLLGAGSIVTTAYLEKANWYLRNKNAVVPLFSKSAETRKLFFVNTGCEYEFRLDSPDFGFQNLTYREVLHRYRGYNLPSGAPISLSKFREIYHETGIKPKSLDQEADPMFYVDEWGYEDSSSAKAYHYLYGLDLFHGDEEEGLRAGDITFMESPHPASDYLGVISHDPVSASLIQGRLQELNHDITVKLA